MKKILVSLLMIVCLIPFVLVGCESDSQPQANLPNLSDCEIGYQLPTYPYCDFNYKVDDNFTVHIDNMSVVLTEKNTINQGDTLDAEFYPYAIKVTATGTTDASNADRIVYFRFKYSESARSSMKATVGHDGTIAWETTLTLYNNFVISFLSVTTG